MELHAQCVAENLLTRRVADVKRVKCAHDGMILVSTANGTESPGQIMV